MSDAIASSGVAGARGPTSAKPAAARPSSASPAASEPMATRRRASTPRPPGARSASSCRRRSPRKRARAPAGHPGAGGRCPRARPVRQTHTRVDVVVAQAHRLKMGSMGLSKRARRKRRPTREPARCGPPAGKGRARSANSAGSRRRPRARGHGRGAPGSLARSRISAAWSNGVAAAASTAWAPAACSQRDRKVARAGARAALLDRARAGQHDGEDADRDQHRRRERSASPARGPESRTDRRTPGRERDGGEQHGRRPRSPAAPTPSPRPRRTRNRRRRRGAARAPDARPDRAACVRAPRRAAPEARIASTRGRGPGCPVSAASSR